MNSNSKMTSVQSPQSHFRGHNPDNKQFKSKSRETLIVTDLNTDDLSEEASPVEKPDIIEFLNDENMYEKIHTSNPNSNSNDSKIVSWSDQISSTYNRINEKHEVPRKLFHSFTGFFTLWLYVNGYDQSIFMAPFIVAATTLASIDFIRFKNEKYNRVFFNTFGFMMRDSEKYTYNGTIFFLLGLIFNVSLLPKDLCVMSSLFLSWGDTSASVIGRELGKYTFQVKSGKSFAGALASFSTGCISCLIVYGHLIPKYHQFVDLPNDIYYTPESSRLSLYQYVIASGLVASISECIDIYDIDDNLTIPVLSGSFLYCLVYLFRI